MERGREADMAFSRRLRRRGGGDVGSFQRHLRPRLPSAGSEGGEAEVADDAAWLEAAPLTLSETQRRARLAYNATEGPLSGETLGSLFLRQARRTPEALAVMTSTRMFSYGEVLRRAGSVARILSNQGVGRGELVGVVTEKDWEEVVAVAGAVLAGAVDRKSVV